MTKEELEKVIQHFKSLRIIQRESFMRKGFDVAIKALKQESVIDEIRSIVAEWKMDIWADNFSYECMSKIAEIIDKAESEDN